MKRFIVIFFGMLCGIIALSQVVERKMFKIVCYNVENFFDCVDDTLTDDSEYLTGGIRGWNYAKYLSKQNNIGKVITAIGGWEAPALVGICEVESNKCLYDLTHYSGLSKLKYEYVHHESPDARGVDVAMLYQPKMFKLLRDEAVRIDFNDVSKSKTRDVLYVSGVVPTGDTLHVFVCHFPSRLGGELESENRRMHVASVVRTKVDSLFSINQRSNIVIMGDFNDFPTNRSILDVLSACPLTDSISTRKLYNLMSKIHAEGKGTNKHSGNWGALDQIIISGNMLNSNCRFFTRRSDAGVFDADFLLEDDKEYLGKKPRRTYVGMKYQGGFSDHLPVYANFWF